METASDELLSFDSALLTPDEELLVERLVDGELSEEERRDLLLMLDEKADGWRFCALTFLEDQELKASIRSLRDRSAQEEAPRPAERVAATKKNDSVLRKTPLIRSYLWSSAAGFLVAAVLGGGYLALDKQTKVGSELTVDSPSVSTDVVPQIPDQNLQPARLAQKTYKKVADANTSTSVADAQDSSETLAMSDGVPESASLAQIPSSQNSTWTPLRAGDSSHDDALNRSISSVQFSGGRNGFGKINVPCVETDKYDPEYLRKKNNAVPPEIVRELNNVGNSVSSRRDEYRFHLDDGRVLILPVDEYEFKYDGSQKVW